VNRELEANTTLSHYRIVSKIGEGGMGEVYLAQDTKLDRRVAIKFLNQEFSKDEDKLNGPRKPTPQYCQSLDQHGKFGAWQRPQRLWHLIAACGRCWKLSYRKKLMQ
jgi:serine/threonine protein kinase